MGKTPYQTDYSRFDEIYETGFWQPKESLSGWGSDMQYTEEIRKRLPIIVKAFDIKSMVDVSCGDLNWIQHIIPEMNIAYFGRDVSKVVIDQTKEKFPMLDIEVMNMVDEIPPKADLIFVRDTFMHMPTEDIEDALDNFRGSGAKYLLASTFNVGENGNTHPGGHRDFDVTTLLGAPILFVPDNSQDYDNPYYKSMGLWVLNEGN